MENDHRSYGLGLGLGGKIGVLGKFSRFGVNLPVVSKERKKGNQNLKCCRAAARNHPAIPY